MIKFIHVIGLVGSGKTLFINKYLKSYPKFDIKDIYISTGYKPSDLQDPSNYSQFSEAIDYTVENLAKQAKYEGFNLAIVESSGINKALNKTMNRYRNLRIWIESEFYFNIYKSRPYAREINGLMIKKFLNGKIKFDCIFDWKFNSFPEFVPSDDFKQYFPSNIL